MHYPEGTLEDGTSTVAFTIDREGTLLNSSIAQSSGSSVLDKAALDTITRAQPMPRPPESVSDDGLSFTVPLRFNGEYARANAKEQERRERQIAEQQERQRQSIEQDRVQEQIKQRDEQVWRESAARTDRLNGIRTPDLRKIDPRTLNQALKNGMQSFFGRRF
jgi:TonB family protein